MEIQIANELMQNEFENTEKYDCNIINEESGILINIDDHLKDYNV